MDIDKVTLHWIWRETDNRIEELSGRVREGLDVQAASEFCRWLQCSRILKLLVEQPFPLPCRPEELTRKVSKLLEACNEWFVNHERSNVKPHPQVTRTELQAINEKLAHMSRAIANLAPPTSGTASAVEASLHVIEGGAK